MFGSAQCLGYHNEYGTLTPDICYPPEKVVLKQVESTVKRTGVKVLFVASDDNKMISKFEKLLKKHDVSIHLTSNIIISSVKNFIKLKRSI